MTDEQAVDEHLVEVLNQVLDAVYQAKQARWSATGSPVQVELQELVSFLIDQSGRLMVAEEAIDGRSSRVSSPSSHQKGNLVGDADGDLAAAVALLVQRLDGIVLDVRERVGSIRDVDETRLLIDLADQLEARARRLLSS